MKNKSLFGYPTVKKVIGGFRKKLFIYLSLAVILPASAQVSQRHLSLHMQERPLSEIMDAIENRTEYRFYYNNKLHDLQKPVSIHADNEPVQTILDKLFKPLKISYQIKGNDIILADPRHAAPSAAENREHTVTGDVRNQKGEPLVGATVVIAGTTRGATTNAAGAFSIRGTMPMVLRVSYIGYQSAEVKVVSATAVSVVLEDEANEMDEVVVIGYGTVKKTDMTGSVTNIKMSDIQDAPVLSVDHALQGRIAGADIMSTTGEPGAPTSIRIRGTRSILASNEPLVVVDGVMDAISDLNDINSADIESISVLKDASSTAIYGSRGANGVIIVTTKKGRSSSGKPDITFKADIGFSQLPRKLDLMNGTEFALYRNDYAYFHSSLDDTTPLSQYTFPDPLSVGKCTDWVDEISRTAGYQNYNISISNSTAKSSYFASLGYNNTEGIIKNSGVERITGRINLSHQLFKWLNISYKGTFTSRDQDNNLVEIGGTNRQQAAIYLSPLIDPDDNFNPYYGNGTPFNTPTALIEQNTNNTKRFSSSHTVAFEVELAKNLKLRSQESYYNSERHIYRYYPSTLPKKNEGEGGEAYRNEYNENSLSSENTLSWNLETKSGHNLNMLGGFTASRSKSNTLTLSGSGYMDDEVTWDNMGAVLDKETYSASSGSVKLTKISYLARINYNYKHRYYLTVTGRFDGASNFAANNKWGFFPSAAVKWNVSNEAFLKDVSWIDDLSLRLSAGRTGNDAISAYRSLAAMSSTTDGYLFSGSQPVAYYRSRLDSPNLTWEKTALYNVALDVALFRNRLSVTAEGYISKTHDLLMAIQTPTATGYSSRNANLGKTTNKGWELSIESRNIVTPKFSWTTNLTFAHNEQTVNDIGSEKFVIASKSPNTGYMMHGYVKGYPLNALWGFRYGGVWKSVEEFERNAVTHGYVSSGTITNYKNSLGLPRYYDIDHDGTLTQNDLVYLGNADPYLYGGLQNSIQIGRLNIGVYFTYSLGGKIYNWSELYMAGSYSTNQYRFMLDAWHPTRNPDSNLPRAGSVVVNVPSDLHVYDASFLRLKNATIGYTFDLRKKTRLLRDIQLSVSGENLWLWKKYNGFDPDVSTESGSSTMRRVDMGAYPKARTIVFSIQVRY